ncbi:hypothetical protein E2C01_020878 [Portunus trituberculatus]|uniref:Uncharacterized protein n=1 Tax=Portunus trituberculatus TaxID=210409 RepID=A0A5B7E2S4_PORTR|nr:hypothetical protein [Portunus trituberculatus]
MGWNETRATSKGIHEHFPLPHPRQPAAALILPPAATHPCPPLSRPAANSRLSPYNVSDVDVCYGVSLAK